MSMQEVAPAPFDIEAANDFQILKFTATTTHAVDAIPDSWRGRKVELYVTGGDLHWSFSAHDDAEIDRSVSATAAGASAKVGAILPDGNYERARVPGSVGTVYFVREASASVTIYMRLLSGPGAARGE